ncbi:aminoglycoside phosphotransferase [Sphingomonas koreensis]|nr:aminoglycoside phosphotransferase [Sphingomonas koreensis]
MTGGDLSTVWRVTLEDGGALVAKEGGGAAIEAAMVAALARRGAPTPAVIGHDANWLLLSLVPTGGSLAGAAWDDLARVLSRLHAPAPGRYGWPADHAFGAVAIANDMRDDWPGFWADHRLRCHAPHLPPPLAARIEALAGRIGDLLPARPPVALLHGDLWGGNVLIEGARVSALIDPACYYGDREVDVAMLTLFDSPPDAFFDALQLAPGWRARLPVYRLWPLLVHVRLFGGGYLASAVRELDALGV